MSRESIALMTHIMDLGYLLAKVQGTGAAIGNVLVNYTHTMKKKYTVI